MKFTNKILAATTVIALATVAIPASAQVFVSKDQTSFDTLRKGIATYSFNFPSTSYGAAGQSLGSSFTSNKVTFSTTGTLVGYNDTLYGKGKSYIATSDANNLTVSYNGPVLGLILGSFQTAKTISYVVNGVKGTLAVAASPSSTFLGFDNGGNSSSIKVTFQDCSELDILGFQTAVPEAATWAMMMVGLGIVGGSLRRRRERTSTRVSLA